MSQCEAQPLEWNDIVASGTADFWASSQGRRLAPLALHLKMRSGAIDRTDADVVYALRRAAAAQSLVLGLLDQELRRVLAALASAGIPVVVIKGAALAHSHYPEPSLRPRGDSAVLVAAVDRARLSETLLTMGYAPSGAVDGDLVTQQFQWMRTLRADLVHTIDAHWRLLNPHAFAHVFTAEEVLRRAIALPGLGPQARGPHPVDALLLACVHRVAHHPGYEDPIWLYDIHLLIGSLSEDDAEAFARLAKDRGVMRVCASGIERARVMFGTRVPESLTALLDESRTVNEPTAQFLRVRRQVGVLASDLRALDDWAPRVRLLVQHLFPPTEYMRRQYGVRGRLGLVPFYAWRIVRGVPRWLGFTSSS